SGLIVAELASRNEELGYIIQPRLRHANRGANRHHRWPALHLAYILLREELECAIQHLEFNREIVLVANDPIVSLAVPGCYDNVPGGGVGIDARVGHGFPDFPNRMPAGVGR